MRFEPMLPNAPSDPEVAALLRVEAVPEEIIRREGYLYTKLKKQGPGPKRLSASWTQTWAVLCVGFLFLFKDQPNRTSHRKPLHVVRLDAVAVDEVGKEVTKKKGAFKVEIDQGDAVWLVYPSKEGEMWEWMDAIKEASREKSTSSEYDNALNRLLPNGLSPPSSTPAALTHSNSKTPLPINTKSSSNLLPNGASAGGSSLPSSPGGTRSTDKPEKEKAASRSRRPTQGAKASGEVDDGSYEGRKQNVKTKIGAFLFKRPSVDKLKEKGIIKDEATVFGGSLALQIELSKELVPPVVKFCVEEVERRGLTSEGIYRLSGDRSTVQKLRLQFNAKESVNLAEDDMDINAVTGVLKLYFRELDDSVIPFGFYARFIAAAKIDDYDSRLIELKNLIQALPRPNYDTLEYIIRHLSRVTAHSAENKMEPSNLAIVFGPTLIRTGEDSQSGYTDILNLSHQNRIVESILVQVTWVFDGQS
ncbi:hypothetical protein HKX48_006846 [Thoreauomyces humboldtii]|nr:hypothetical protein HKX48_006846 [Thoreauomyces humboldtii]